VDSINNVRLHVHLHLVLTFSGKSPVLSVGVWVEEGAFSSEA
jgi:hypothetical protein